MTNPREEYEQFCNRMNKLATYSDKMKNGKISTIVKYSNYLKEEYDYFNSEIKKINDKYGDVWWTELPSDVATHRKELREYLNELNILIKEDVEDTDILKEYMDELKENDILGDNGGCENEDIENLRKEIWEERNLKSWGDVYINNPIFIVNAHGALTTDHLTNYELPNNTQVISSTRSGVSAIRNPLGYDIVKSTYDIRDTSKYIFEPDGITRPFNYKYLPTIRKCPKGWDGTCPPRHNPNNRYECSIHYKGEDCRERKYIEPVCQKLYRTGDYINNILLKFNDHNGAFQFSDFIKSPYFQAQYDDIISHRSLIKLKPYNEWSKYDSTGIYVYNDPEKKALASIKSYDFKLSYEDLELHYYKMVPEDRELDFDLISLISTLGRGTYFLNSCKSGSGQSSELARQISRVGLRENLYREYKKKQVQRLAAGQWPPPEPLFDRGPRPPRTTPAISPLHTLYSRL